MYQISSGWPRYHSSELGNDAVFSSLWWRQYHCLLLCEPGKIDRFKFVSWKPLLVLHGKTLNVSWDDWHIAFSSIIFFFVCVFFYTNSAEVCIGRSSDNSFTVQENAERTSYAPTTARLYSSFSVKVIKACFHHFQHFTKTFLCFYASNLLYCYSETSCFNNTSGEIK